jgi:hypothetical protein
MASNITRVSVTVAASQTDSAIAAAVAGKRHRVLSGLIGCTGTASAGATYGSKIGSETTVAISPLLTPGVNALVPLSHNSNGWFETETGGALVLTTGTGGSIQSHFIIETYTP